MKSAAALGLLLLVLCGCTSPQGSPVTSATPGESASAGARDQGRNPGAGSTEVGCPVSEAAADVPPETLRGINVAGGEFTHTAAGLPGVSGQEYRYPGAALLSYLASRGHCLVRIPFRWERVQPELGGELSASGLAELREAVQAASDAGLHVLLDLHNYGSYIRLDDTEVRLAEGIEDEHLADVWTRLARAFADERAVVGWGLMNEPNGLEDPESGPTTWHSASQAAVDAIRATGDDRAVFVAGDEWSGAQRWPEKNGDPWIEDPVDNVVYEAHYYFDPNNSGAFQESYADVEEDAVERGHADLDARIEAELGDFVEWLDEHDQRGFIGEMGWPTGEEEDEWNSAGSRAYEVLDEAGIGATYWATGEHWGDGYPLNPYDDETLTALGQAEVIEEHLRRRRAGD